MNDRLSHIASKFGIYGDFLWGERYGSGHINDTFMGVFNQSGERVRYIFQRVNTNVFKCPESLMENISRTLFHLHGKLRERHDASRRAMTLVPTHDMKPYFKDAEGGFWRCYLFIERARTYDIMEDAGQAFEAAKAFGAFQMLLSDLPLPRLHETIPGFHNTPARLAAFDEALKKDLLDRASGVKEEIAFVDGMRPLAPTLMDLLEEGRIPERTVHNDTKLNNVMIDDETGEGICVIDFDTVMPGLSLYDFGDLVRTSVSPSLEDERDISKVSVREDVFESLARGFLEGTAGALNKEEIEQLPFSGALITFETGVRFLTDYLDGDRYFKTRREGHNLDRCRTQFRLVSLLREKEDALLKKIRSFK